MNQQVRWILKIVDLVLKFLLEMNREGKTVIIVTHDTYVAQQCHRIIELGKGK